MRGPLRAFEGVPGDVNVLEPGAGEAADGDAVADQCGDALHGLEVAGAGDGKAGLDHVHAEPFELAGDLHLLVNVERRPRRLLAVAQGGVEDLDSVGGHGTLTFSQNRPTLAARPVPSPCQGRDEDGKGLTPM